MHCSLQSTQVKFRVQEPEAGAATGGSTEAAALPPTMYCRLAQSSPSSSCSALRSAPERRFCHLLYLSWMSRNCRLAGGVGQRGWQTRRQPHAPGALAAHRVRHLIFHNVEWVALGCCHSALGWLQRLTWQTRAVGSRTGLQRRKDRAQPCAAWLSNPSCVAPEERAQNILN